MSCSECNDPLNGLKALLVQLDQSSINTRWLLASLDEIHDALCPEQSGTWQQRVEQAVKAAKQKATGT